MKYFLLFLIPTFSFAADKLTTRTAKDGTIYRKIGDDLWEIYKTKSRPSILNCVEVTGALIDFNGKVPVAESSGKPKNPSKLIFVYTKDGAKLKGNLSEVNLVKLTNNSYVEVVSGVNGSRAYLYSIVETGVETYIFHHKSYFMGSKPFGIMTVYKCN